MSNVPTCRGTYRGVSFVKHVASTSAGVTGFVEQKGGKQITKLQNCM